jgi:hypothetical protein
MRGWSSDVPISLPEPHEGNAIVKMHGFVFTDLGMAHDMDIVDFESIAVPSAPASDPVTTIYDDESDAEFI